MACLEKSDGFSTAVKPVKRRGVKATVVKSLLIILIVSYKIIR